MRRLLLTALTLALLLGTARADPPPSQPPPPPADPGPPGFGWSVGVGLVTAIVPLAVGGDLLALSSDHTTKHTGIDVIAGGLALAPIVSHLIAHEWKRAAIFGVVPLLAGALAVGLLEGSSDDLLDNGTPPPRVAFGAALAVELLASGVGLADSLMARQRARARTPPRGVTIAPTFGRNQIGLSLGGWM